MIHQMLTQIRAGIRSRYHNHRQNGNQLDWLREGQGVVVAAEVLHRMIRNTGPSQTQDPPVQEKMCYPKVLPRHQAKHYRLILVRVHLHPLITSQLESLLILLNSSKMVNPHRQIKSQNLTLK